MEINIQNTSEDLVLIRGEQNVRVMDGLLCNIVETTYDDLKALRDAGGLIPGSFYRITDFVTTTIQENTRSAGHQFDIIVRADSIDTLNENASAIQHEGDTYFSNSNLAAWELKYSLDNILWTPGGEKLYRQDSEVGGWFEYGGTIEIDSIIYHKWVNNAADYGQGSIGNYCFVTEDEDSEYLTYVLNMDTNELSSGYDDCIHYDSILGGKGTITWMKDEFNNECPYDFKNIQFQRWKSSHSTLQEFNGNYFTCTVDVDNIPSGFGPVDETDFIWAYTFSSDCSGGEQKDTSIMSSYVKDNIIKKHNSSLNGIVFYGSNCSYNTFGESCSHNTFGISCHQNTFSYGCSDNTFDIFCQRNTFGPGCSLNTFGNNCSDNEFGNDCDHNTFGGYCSSNTFGNNCGSNTFGNNCTYNTFGNSCSNNKFGNNYKSNTFGVDCDSIKFQTLVGAGTLKNYCRYIIVENGNQCIYLDCSATTSDSSYFQNVKIAQGVNNTNTYKTITHATAGDTFQTIYKPQNSTEVEV